MMDVTYFTKADYIIEIVIISDDEQNGELWICDNPVGEVYKKQTKYMAEIKQGKNVFAIKYKMYSPDPLIFFVRSKD